MNWPAVRTSIFLSSVFLIVYGGTNWITASRLGVGSVFLPSERSIPFLPPMIIPYMSIDIFFIAAPFFAVDMWDRRALAWRITMAIVIAGACFLIFPLRFAFTRPIVAGPLGLIFNNFRLLDQPFNQFPSLHIALCTILAQFYAKRYSGVWRVMLLFWFGLIALSTAVTFQHHLIDLAGGFGLAVLIFSVTRDLNLQRDTMRNLRVGIYYCSACAALILLSYVARPWSLILLYPATSLAIVSGGYFGLGAIVFHKSNGLLSLGRRLLFGPVLIGHRLSLAWYARRCDAWNRLDDHIWIGRHLNDHEAKALIGAGVAAVLDLTTEFSEPLPLRNIPYFQSPILDLTAPSIMQVRQCLAWIDRYRNHGPVYIHCKAGYSRTAAIAGAYLIARAKFNSAEEASRHLHSIRPTMVIRPEVRSLLEEIAATRESFRDGQSTPAA